MNRNHGRVSIIMGVYNGELWVRKSIESIIAQTYKDWQFIICDDCSTDNTYAILEEYREQYPDKFVVLKNEKNMRLAATLNNCLAAAQGEYIARMDADDESLPERLQREVEFLDSHPEIDCVGTGRVIFDDEGEYGTCAELEYPTKDTLIKHVPFAHPTIMMRASVYRALGGYTVSKETMRAEDLDLWFRFFAEGYKGYVLQEPLYKYRESKEDFKKRSFKTLLGAYRVKVRGFKLLHIPKRKWIWSLKALVLAMVPRSIQCKYHRKKYKKRNE